MLGFRGIGQPSGQIKVSRLLLGRFREDSRRGMIDAIYGEWPSLLLRDMEPTKEPYIKGRVRE